MLNVVVVGLIFIYTGCAPHKEVICFDGVNSKTVMYSKNTSVGKMCGSLGRE